VTGFSWLTIARLGLVQAAIGALVMLSTSVLNRVMVVELGLAAAIPAGLVAWHYAVQLSRPVWGHGSDRGRHRSPWIVAGMAALALGSLLAVDMVAIGLAGSPLGSALLVLAFTLIGAGVGACGTSLLSLLAAGVAAERRAAAAAMTWVMMVAGIVVSAIVTGALLQPFSMGRLAIVAGGLALTALMVTIAALRGIEARASLRGVAPDSHSGSFARALAEVRADPEAVRFTWFVFAAMLAYSMQDLILEPFAGLVFAASPGASTQMSGGHQGGVLAGMIVAGVAGSAFRARTPLELRPWIVSGCAGSAMALLALVAGAADPHGWPLVLNLVTLGFCNGVFAVAAIGAMMGLVGSDRSGVRLGVWGAAQAIAFGVGGLGGALIVDLGRRFSGADSTAFQLAFAMEAALFLWAALLATRATRVRIVRVALA
jgi:MFS transporter, BCD family, chlorophyll transporter